MHASKRPLTFLRRSRVLVDYGYTEAKLANGAQLLAEAEALATKRAKDSGESRQATEELNAPRKRKAAAGSAARPSAMLQALPG